MAPIPTDANVGRAVWSGTYGSTPEEIFAYGRWFYYNGDDGLEAVLDTIQDDVTNMLAESTTGSTPFSSIGQMFPEDVKWTLLKVHEVNSATGAMLGESHMRELTDAGSGADTGLPYQLSLAVTAEAAFPDRKRRSRFYLPRFVQDAVDGFGRVKSPLVEDIQTQLAFQQGANLIADASVQYCILHKGLVRDVHVIDRFRTGDVIDTIRRRRNKLPEVRTITTL